AQELDIWMRNPLLGEGFASQSGLLVKGEMVDTGAYGHNGWSSVLATTGIFGFAGFASVIGAMFVVGRWLVFQGHDRGAIMLGAITFTGSIFLFVNVLTSGVWIERLALLFGVLCGMAL